LAEVTELQLLLSVGEKIAEITAVVVSDGVQVQVATPEDVALEPQSVIVVAPFIKLKFPAVFAEALIVTGEPYVTELAPPGIESARVGLPLLTRITTEYG
jgi:hypothetical protein